MSNHVPESAPGRVQTLRKALWRVAIVGMAGLLSACSFRFPLELTGETSYAVLQNLIVEYKPFDGDRYAGAFDFSLDERPFFEFGAVVESPEGPKRLPTFEYLVAADAWVVSPVDGVITKIHFDNNHGDYAVWIRPNETSNVFVEIDHVLNLQVARGDRVAAGQRIGHPGTYGIDGVGRVELMVKLTGQYWCPLALLETSVRQKHEQDVARLMEDWETFSGDDAAYAEQAMVVPGCNAWSYTDEDLR